MTRHSTQRPKEPVLRLSICLIGVFLLIFALRAHGQEVHQLSYNGSRWMDQNLNGVTADPYTGLSAFLTTPNNQIHVYYLANNGKGDNFCSYTDEVHQLFYNGTSWADEDLTVLSGGVPAIACTPVTGFSVENYQYVYFIAGDLSIHQLVYNNIGWSDSNLTALAGGPQAWGTSILAFTTTPAVHIYYSGYPDLHVHQIYTTDGTQWQDQDLTKITNGARGPDLPNQMVGFNVGNLQYVYFLSNDDGHVHRFFYNNSSWSDEDLTAITKTTTHGFATTLAAIAIPGTNKLRVYLNDSRDHILQLASTDSVKWTASDLSKKTSGPPAAVEDGILAVASPKKLLNVYYVSAGDVIRIFQPTSSTWSHQDLTALTGGGTISGFYGSPLAGLSLQNSQNIFYLAQ